MKTLKLVCGVIFMNMCFINSNCQTLKSSFFWDNSDSAKVSVFADGNIKGLIANQSSNQTATSGAIGISVKKSKTNWNAWINIASTIDTLKTDFGTIVLNPASGKRFTSGLLEVYRQLNSNTGCHLYASGSSSNWILKDTLKSATVFGLGALFTYDIIPLTKAGENNLYFGFEVGPSYRGIFGNIINDKNFYSRIMGTEGNHFAGLEGGLKITFNNITAGLQGYWLWDWGYNKKIDGITSFQITGGISISGSIFNTTVKTKKSAK